MSSVITRFQECPDLDFLYADEDMVRENGEFLDPFFKPCWSPDLLIGMNYVGRFNVMRKQLLLDIGADWGDIANDGFYHLVLRVAEETNKIGRVPQVLSHCHITDESSDITAGQSELMTAQMKSLQDALNRRGNRLMWCVTVPGRSRCTTVFQGTLWCLLLFPQRSLGYATAVY